MTAPPPDQPTGRDAWRKALADLARARRNRRGKRPAPPVVGVRVPAPQKPERGEVTPMGGD